MKDLFVQLPKLSAPLLVVLELTKRCNLHCSYCYNCLDNPNEKIVHTHTDFPLEKIYKVIDDIADSKVFHINLSGGEPFLHKNIIDIVRYIKSKKIGISIVSNGTMITKQIAEDLNNLGIIKSMQISFDSHIKEIHNKTREHFDKALGGFKLLVNAANNRQFSPSVGIVVNKFNFQTIIDTIDYFSNFTSRFHLMNVMGHPESALTLEERKFYKLHILPKIQNLMKSKNFGCSIFDNRYQNLGIDTSKSLVNQAHINCLAGYTSMVIGADLEAYPCDIARDCIGSWQKMGDIKNLYRELQNNWFNRNTTWCHSRIKEKIDKYQTIHFLR